MTTIGQMSLALPVAADPSGLATTDLRGVSKTAAMISAIVDAIPMVGHAKGTRRETVQRPVAYLYARRDGLGPEDRRLVVGICAAVTGERRAETVEALGATVIVIGGALGEEVTTRPPMPVWLRLNGERAQTANGQTAARDAWRTFGRRALYNWRLDIASRCSPKIRAQIEQAKDAVGFDMRCTLAGILLALSWSPDVATLVQWRRDGVLVGDDMRVRADLAEARGELDIDTLTRVHRLLAIPATAPLMLALADVPAS